MLLNYDNFYNWYLRNTLILEMQALGHMTIDAITFLYN